MTWRAQEALDAMMRFPQVEPAAFVRRGLMVIAPHPDDESLGCGGLIAACRAAGRPVTLILVSDGAGSHPNSRQFPAARLADLRRAELLEAARRLNVEMNAVHGLGLPDRAVPMYGPQAQRAISSIAELSRGADVMTVTWRHDPHADHHASFALAREARMRVPGITLWEYPIWGLTLPPDTPLEGPPVHGVRVRIAPAFRAAKRAAIAAHASQTSDLIADDPAGFRLTPDMLTRFDTPFETFIGPMP